jgi:O-antigen/teichoic acid export membrane protein
MSETPIVLAAVAFGIVVPAVVYGLILTGVARYGHTVIATASWTVCLALIVVHRYGTDGVDAMVVAAVVLMLACMLWTWSYREFLAAGTIFRSGGYARDATVGSASIAARVPGGPTDPDRGTDTASSSRKENE